jgi:hypothetical protein
MTELTLWVTVWLAAAVFLIARHWRLHRGVGLVLGYVISFGALHWLSSAVNLLPWNPHPQDAIVTLGMQQSALAMLTFAIGAEFVLRARQVRVGTESAAGDRGIAINHAAVNLYLMAGLALHVILLPIARGLPSVTALVSTGSTLMVTALGLKCWNAWHDGRPVRVVGWMLASATLPFFTVATQGYLGYGFAALLMVLVFMASFYGPSVRLFAAAVLFGYLGMSVYVTYMRDRDDLRSIVWSGSGLGERVASIRESVAQFEWFSLEDPEHLLRIDRRLNQNFLVGAAVARVEAGQVELAHGATFIDALYALLPRALWPEKQIAAGSGDLVSTYTGFRFARHTSVGIGQVLECYVNFGTLGVLLCFLLLGAATAFVDGLALRALWEGNIRQFTMWYVPGIALLNLGGSFVEATSTAAAGLIMATLVGAWTTRVNTRVPVVELAARQSPAESAEVSR